MTNQPDTTALDAARSEFFEAQRTDDERYWAAHFANGGRTTMLSTEAELVPAALRERLKAPQAEIKFVEAQLRADQERAGEVFGVLRTSLARLASRLASHGPRPLPTPAERVALLPGEDFPPSGAWERARDGIVKDETEPLGFCLREFSAIDAEARAAKDQRPPSFAVPRVFSKNVLGANAGLGGLREIITRTLGADLSVDWLRRIAESIGAGDLVELCLRARVRLNEITDTIARVEARLARESARVSDYEQAERRLGGSHHGAAR